jgi:hypothetical protein
MDRLHNLADELEQRLEGHVDMSTIDWIWDEIEAVSVYGKNYSEDYRPTTPERLQAAKSMPPEIQVE